MQTIDLKQFPINHLDLHGETLITAIEIEVSAFEMEALIKSNPDKPETMTSSYIRSFYNSLSYYIASFKNAYDKALTMGFSLEIIKESDKDKDTVPDDPKEVAKEQWGVL